jgi:GAF domain-containing protein
VAASDIAIVLCGRGADLPHIKPKISLKKGVWLHDPLPLNRDERARLSVVRSLGIWDAEPHARLDRLVELARFVFETPMAAISVIDEDQLLFMARAGVDIVTMQRADTFCAYAIQQATPFIVLDTAADRRFVTNPLVLEPPHIRFYAGAPIITREGAAIGTLCIFADRPRSHFGAEDLRVLLQIARMATDQIDSLVRNS